MRAYIDESGDEGTIGKGSRWLIFGCAMVADAELDTARSTVQLACTAARNNRNPKALHFKDIPHDDKRGLISIIRDGPWVGTIVASDTTAVLPNSMLATPSRQYSYAARFLVERISRRASILEEPATIYFERRRNFDLNSFRDYIALLLRRNEPRLDSQWISPDRIYVMDKGIDECLCIADGLANAAYKALEPHRVWNSYEMAYLEAFEPSLWKGPMDEQDIHNWGFVLMPRALFGGFANEYPWIMDLGK